MGEIDHAEDAEDHCVADGNKPVDRSERDAVDQLLKKQIQPYPQGAPREASKAGRPRQSPMDSSIGAHFVYLQGFAIPTARTGKRNAAPVAPMRPRFRTPHSEENELVLLQTACSRDDLYLKAICGRDRCTSDIRRPRAACGM